MNAVLSHAAQNAHISRDLINRLWLSRLRYTKSASMEAQYTFSVPIDPLEPDASDAFDLFLVMDFERKAVRFLLGATFVGVGSDVFESYEAHSGCPVAWLKALQVQASQDNGSDSEVAEEIRDLIAENPLAFDRLIERTQSLKTWLEKPDEDVELALELDPKPIYVAEPLDPILHFMVSH